MAGRKHRSRPKRDADRPSETVSAAGPADRARPWLLGAAVALYVARPLFPSEGSSAQGDGLPLVMLWLALGVFWLLGAIGRRGFRVRFGAVDAAVLLLVAWHSVAAVWAAVRVTPRAPVNVLWEWVGLGMGFFLLRQLLLTRREARAAVALMVALAVGLSGYGMYQYAYEMPQTRARYEADPDRALREAGLWYPPGSPQRQQFEARLESPEPLATFALTNSLAGVLAPWLVVLVGIGVGGGVRPPGESPINDAVGGDSSRRPKAAGRPTHGPRSAVRPVGDWSRLLQGWLVNGWVAVGLGGLTIAACLVLTKSRSAYVATALGLATVLFLAGRQRFRFGWKWPVAAAVAIAVLVGAAVATGGLDLPVLAEAPKSLVYRLEYWQSTLAMIADRPVLGCGPGNFQGVYTAYKLPQASEEVADPHNFLLEVWATAGTPAMLALAAALGIFFWRVAGTLRLPSAEQRTDDSSGHGIRSVPATVEEDGEDAAWFVYGGAAAGLLGPLLLSLLTPEILEGMFSVPPRPDAVGIVLLPAAAAAALFIGWVRGGRLAPVLPAIGVAVLLVHLLAAGGIGFPGVAGSLWLLVALGLRAEGVHTLGRPTAFGGVAVMVALAFACYRTAYGPVVRARGAVEAAQGALAEGRIDRAERYFQRAAVADPWAAAPLRELASLSLQRWYRERDPAALARFEQYLDESLRRSPLSSSTWETAGDWLSGVFAKTGDPEHLGRAVAMYRRAVEVYPTSATGRAKLAVALDASGQRDEARREAREALRLHGLTPHADKKLPDELRGPVDRLASPRSEEP